MRIQGIIVEFISVKCYNERAWEAKTVSQALCVTTEETGGNLLMKKRALNKELQMESPLPWGIWLFPLRFGMMAVQGGLSIWQAV